MITFGSVCSGIESASVAWEPLGLKAAWLAEVEAFPSAVLAHHWPDVPNLGDMCNLPYLVSQGLINAPDVLVGGTPCQAFSVAGLRKGLADERGQLTLKFVELANGIDSKRPGDECVVVWENVPGVLSSKDNAFGCFLGALAGECEPLQPAGAGWSNAGLVHGPERTIAWRVLDAQYFGVAQRRRRVFVVASARSGFSPAAVLFESEGVRRDTPPSREKAAVVAALTANGVGTCGADDNQGQAGHLITGKAHGQGGAEVSDERSPTLTCNHEAPIACIQNATRGKSQNGLGVSGPDDPMYTLDQGSQHAVACYAFQPRIARNGRGDMGDLVGALNAQAGTTGKGDAAPCVAGGSQVRRLTPIECERLQGFDDNHTRIPWRGKSAEDCPDGPRYKAIGNSKAVPVVRFVGARILKELLK